MNTTINTIKILFLVSVLFLVAIPCEKIIAQEKTFVYMQDGNFYKGCDEFKMKGVNYSIEAIQDVNGDFYVSPHMQQCPVSSCNSCGENHTEWSNSMKEHLYKMDSLNINTIRITSLMALSYNHNYIPTDDIILQTKPYFVQKETNYNCYNKEAGFPVDPFIFEQRGDLLQQVIDIIYETGLDMRIIPLMGGHGVEMLEQLYGEYLSYIANRFKDEPVIIGYDLYNEPEAFQFDNNLTKDTLNEICFRWYNDIKYFAPAHYVTIGTGLFAVNSWDPGIMPVDFISFHIYANRSEIENWDFLQPIKRYKVFLKYISEQFTVPYIIGETGYSAIDSYGSNCTINVHPRVGSISDQAHFAQESLKYTNWYGHKGYTWWKYKDTYWYECNKEKAIQNYFGMVYLPEVSPNYEEHKGVGDIIKNYDFSECNDCTEPDSAYYHNPTFVNQDNTIFTGIIKESGNPVEDVFVWAIINAKFGGFKEHCFAFTNSSGEFYIKTSYSGLVSNLEFSMHYSKPGMTHYWEHNEFIPTTPVYYNIDFLLDLKTKPEYNNNWTIAGDSIWDFAKVPGPNDVIIEAGASLTLSAPMYFNEGSKLIVKRGGKLIIDNGGKLTSNCEGLWSGVEVWGTSSASQNITDQGWVEMKNGGIIENAICGVQTIRWSVPDGGEIEVPDYNYTGGIVIADDAIFRNNTVAVKFWQYNYTSSNSLFRNSQFITDENLLENTDPGYFIKMTDIEGIIIAGCSFTDFRDVSPEKLTSGIEAYDAGFSVWTQSGQESEFAYLYYGIRAYAYGTTKSITIKDSWFRNNFRSFYLSAINGVTVTGNTFESWDETVTGGENSYCMYLDYCTDYTVEENEFIYNGLDPTGIGLVINNSGPNNNEIYRNDFTNLEYATLAQNNNRGYLDEIGLKIKCNDYWDNYQDIAVTADEEVQYPGIARNQGAEGATDMQAGNRFSLNSNGNDISDYSTFKQGPINYYHHKPDLEPKVKPVYISKYINPEEQNNDYIEVTSCPPNESGVGGGGSGDEELKGRMTINEFKVDSTQSILTALVDGGNTEVLEQEVLQSMPPETYDLYMSLMGKSPYLSDSVLIAAIEKENVLSNVLIKDILVANPQAAKSNEVMEKVDKKPNPLDEDLLAEVLLGQYLVAAKERLEAYLAYYKHQRSTALKYLKQLYRNDTVNPWAHDSLIFLLESEIGLNEKYELVFEYIAMDNWSVANNLFDSLPVLYSMNTQQQEIYQEVRQFREVLLTLHQMDSTIYNMPGTLITSLYDLVDNSQNFAASMARNILIEVDGYEYAEPVILPEASLKSGNIVFDLPNLKNFTPEYVKIYPNPALDYIIVELNTGNATGAVLSLFDNQGRELQRVYIPAQQQNYLLGLKDVPTGMYIVKMECNGKNIGSKKFNVVK